MAVEEVAAREQTEDALKAGAGRGPFPLRYLRPRMGAALALWRGGGPQGGAPGVLPAPLSCPLGRGDPLLDDIGAWPVRGRIGRARERLAAPDDAVGAVRRGAVV